jgi:hypothetical protein
MSVSSRIRLGALAVLLALPAGVRSPGAHAGQIESAIYFSIRRGMTDGEVLVRAGSPDLVTSPGLESVEVRSGMVARPGKGEETFSEFRRTRAPTIERWHYIPGYEEHDPYLTIITFRGGDVWEVQRIKVFSRQKPPAASTGTGVEPVRDEDIRRERADNTLEAAEAYAATRAKLKEQAGAEGAGELEHRPSPEAPTTIYRSVQPDGSTYFGDSPPGENPKVITVQ